MHLWFVHHSPFLITYLIIFDNKIIRYPCLYRNLWFFSRNPCLSTGAPKEQKSPAGSEIIYAMCGWFSFFYRESVRCVYWKRVNARSQHSVTEAGEQSNHICINVVQLDSWLGFFTDRKQQGHFAIVLIEIVTKIKHNKQNDQSVQQC